MALGEGAEQLHGADAMFAKDGESVKADVSFGDIWLNAFAPTAADALAARRAWGTIGPPSNLQTGDRRRQPTFG